jgi:hypothetical protein
MSLDRYRTILKDAVIYNIHYAPKYPREDCTDLDRELGQIRTHLSSVKALVRAGHSLTQIEFAEHEVEAAFVLYKAGQDGRKHLEEAIRYIDKSRMIAPPKVDFVVGTDGQTKPGSR